MNIEFLSWLKLPEERNYCRKKKNRGDEPIGIIINICMEISQVNSLVDILISNYQKCYIYFFLFSSTKSENRRVEQVLPWGSEQLVPMGWGKVVGKGVRRVNMVQMYLHMYVNTKMIPVETMPGMRMG
jgi:hypothetical protein